MATPSPAKPASSQAPQNQAPNPFSFLLSNLPITTLPLISVPADLETKSDSVIQVKPCGPKDIAVCVTLDVHKLLAKKSFRHAAQQFGKHAIVPGIVASPVVSEPSIWEKIENFFGNIWEKALDIVTGTDAATRAAEQIAAAANAIIMSALSVGVGASLGAAAARPAARAAAKAANP